MEFNEIIERLKEGNRHFVNDKLKNKLQSSRRRKALTGGQSPYAVVLGCADSRVVPELIFDTGLGEIFVVRVAGNVANDGSIASIEYAVRHLETGVIIVLGHEDCGAVIAAVEGGDHGYNLNRLLVNIKPSIEQLKGEDIDRIIKKNAALAAVELLHRSPILAGAAESGKLKVLPTYYHLASGEVEFLAS